MKILSGIQAVERYLNVPLTLVPVIVGSDSGIATDNFKYRFIDLGGGCTVLGCVSASNFDPATAGRAHLLQPGCIVTAQKTASVRRLSNVISIKSLVV